MLAGRRVSMAATLLLPAGLVLYFAFNSGGFYPGAPAYIAVLLCLVLVVRVAFAGAPFAGFSRSFAVAAGSLALYSLITLLSGAWSRAPGVARVEFDLPLLYLLVMVLFGLIPRTRTRLRWMLRALASAAASVCVVGLITRLLPHLWPISPAIANNRLSFPVSYWNALGLVAALGIVLCVHLSSDLREPRLSRVLAAGCVPLLASTLLFTFSRGAIATCVVSLVVYMLIGRPRAVVSSLLAIGPATAVSLKVAYDGNLLATLDPTTPPAVAQGHHVAAVVAACAVAAAVLRAVLAASLDEWLNQVAVPDRLRRRAAWAGWGSIVAAAVIAVAALHGSIAHEYQRFLRSGGPAGSNGDLRARLTDPANNGRLDMWKVAWDQLHGAAALGSGAGTYQDTWARYRPNAGFVRDAHSLYLETLDELGIVGLALLLVAVLTVLARVASRARGAARPLYAAVFAVLLGWALHAGIDWDWEMPVVTIIFFSLGGFVLSRRVRPGQKARQIPSAVPPGVLVRAAVGVAFAVLAVLPAFTWLSQRRLDDAADAFARGDCLTARRSALTSISTLGIRAEPYEIVAYCDVRLGTPRLGLAALGRAVRLDPENWNYRYDVALVRAAAGLDPRAAARLALTMDPREPLVQQEWAAFRSGDKAKWKAEADTIAKGFTTL